MSYVIKTPLLAESVDVIRRAIAGLESGAIEPRPAGQMISGARAFQTAISTDIKARLAAPRIAAQEARLIEGSEDAKSDEIKKIR